MTETNDKPSEGEMEVLKSQLEAEQQARAEFEAQAAEKDSQIARLTAEVERLTADVQVLKEDAARASEAVTQLQAELAQATTKYREMVAQANPAIPAELVQGSTIEEIDASVVKARSLVEKVKAGIEAETKALSVPAGAPGRAGVSLEGLSPREKIIYGLSQARNKVKTQ